MMASKTKPTQVKASESVVAGLMARLFGTPVYDTVRAVIDDASDRGNVDIPTAVSGSVMYPWLADVPAQIMSDKLGALVEHVLAHEEGCVFLVKDSFRSGSGGLWLVRVGDFEEDSYWRGFFNYFLVGDSYVKITAVQLETCLRNLL